MGWSAARLPADVLQAVAEEVLQLFRRIGARHEGQGDLRLVLSQLFHRPVVSPFAVVPEAFLSVFGLADDAVVASWIAAALVNETENFLRWERTGSPVGICPTPPSFPPAKGNRSRACPSS